METEVREALRRIASEVEARPVPTREMLRRARYGRARTVVIVGVAATVVTFAAIAGGSSLSRLLEPAQRDETPAAPPTRGEQARCEPDGVCVTGRRIVLQRLTVAGAPFRLVAYRSNEGLCIEFAGEKGAGGGCGVSLPKRSVSAGVGFLGNPDVTYLLGRAREEVGGVVADLADGRRLRAKTVAVPELSAQLRFFVIPVPGEATFESVTAIGTDGDEFETIRLPDVPDPPTPPEVERVPPPPQSGLPPPVARVRSRILIAAQLNDYNVLRPLVHPDVFLSDFGFGSDEVPDPVARWEQRGDEPLETMSVLLRMRHRVRETNEGRLYEWPRFGTDSRIEDLSPRERRLLLRIVTEREMRGMFASECGYMGPRLGILADGTWWIFILDGGC